MLCHYLCWTMPSWNWWSRQKLFRSNFNTMRPKQNGYHLTDNIRKCVFLGDILYCWLYSHWKIVSLKTKHPWIIWHSLESQSVILFSKDTQIGKFMGPTWGPPGSCQPPDGPHVGPMNLTIRVHSLILGLEPGHQAGWVVIKVSKYNGAYHEYIVMTTLKNHK